MAAYGITSSHTIEGGPLECGHRLVAADLGLYAGRRYPCRECDYEQRTLLAVDSEAVTAK